ncbi:MAG: hypothetical protein ACM3JB_10405 [Acidobacteriaceae bacterium]
MLDSNTSEFKPAELKTDFAGRTNDEFGSRGERHHALYRLLETAFRGVFVRKPHQPGLDISGIGDRLLGESLGALCEFIKFPCGGLAIELCHSKTKDSGSAYGGDQSKSLDVALAGETLSASLHPENAGGQQGVDAGLHFTAGDGRYGNASRALTQETSHVHRPERMFKIGGEAERLESPAGKTALQRSPKHTLEGGARDTLG